MTSEINNQINKIKKDFDLKEITRDDEEHFDFAFDLFLKARIKLKNERLINTLNFCDIDVLKIIILKTNWYLKLMKHDFIVTAIAVHLNKKA